MTAATRTAATLSHAIQDAPVLPEVPQGVTASGDVARGQQQICTGSRACALPQPRRQGAGMSTKPRWHMQRRANCPWFSALKPRRRTMCWERRLGRLGWGMKCSGLGPGKWARGRGGVGSDVYTRKKKAARLAECRGIKRPEPACRTTRTLIFTGRRPPMRSQLLTSYLQCAAVYRGIPARYTRAARSRRTPPTCARR